MKRHEGIQRIKEDLKKYKDMQAQYRVLISREITAGDPYENISIKYDEIRESSPTYKTTSKIESALIKNEEFILKSNVLAKKLEEINIALDVLNIMQREIVRLKYMEKHRWDFVADSVGYSESQCKRQGKIALMIMAEVMYSIKTEGVE